MGFGASAPTVPRVTMGTLVESVFDTVAAGSWTERSMSPDDLGDADVVLVVPRAQSNRHALLEVSTFTAPTGRILSRAEVPVWGRGEEEPLAIPNVGRSMNLIAWNAEPAARLVGWDLFAVRGVRPADFVGPIWRANAEDVAAAASVRLDVGCAPYGRRVVGAVTLNQVSDVSIEWHLAGQWSFDIATEVVATAVPAGTPTRLDVPMASPAFSVVVTNASAALGTMHGNIRAEP